MNKTKLKALAEKGDKKAKLTLKLSDNYDKLISTILIGNNIVNILLASLGTVIFVSMLGDIGATVSTVVITVTVLIFGEISPKSIAKDCPEKFAVFSAPIINALIILFTPLNFIFSQWKKLISKIFHVENDSKMSQEELIMLVNEVQQDGSIDENESELLRNAIEFGDLKAQDILTPRVDLEAVSTKASNEEIARHFTESRFSRLLVYEDTLDKIVGVIHQKDFYCGTGMTTEPIQKIMTPPVFVPRAEKLDSLLQALQANKSHIAVVIDEYGGTLGIITMEDILEELVGDIWDEHDEVEIPIREISENTYSVDGSISIDDFCKHFNIKNNSDSASLSGWIMEQLERIPQEGDSLSYENLDISVTKTDGRRVEYVQIFVNKKELAENMTE